MFRPFSYRLWDISEWLINYEGGFVRRGLDGQMLYWLYNLHPFDVIFAIKSIVCICSVLMLYLVFKIFKKQGWSLTILLLGCSLFYLIFQLTGRRDIFLLLCVFCLFFCYKNYIFHTRKWLWGSLFVLLSVFVLLSHEAFVFCSFPIMVVYALSFLYNKDIKPSGVRTYIRLFGIFIPAFLTFLLVTYHKGNAEIAREIWASWAPLFRAYPDTELPFDSLMQRGGSGVNALGWETIRTMKVHFLINTTGIDVDYLVNDSAIPTFKPNFNTLLFFWIYIATYYLVTHLNTVKIGWWHLSNEPQTSRISQVLLVQFVFMLPMFTVLSCDYGRTFPYWVLSSLFALHVFGDLRLPLVAHISAKIEGLFPQSPLRSKILFAVCFFLYPFWSHSPSINTILLVPYTNKLWSIICAYL